MPNVKFIIRFDSDELQSVYVTSRFGRNEKLMYSTPLKVESIFWDGKRQRVKASRYCRYSEEVNEALNTLESKINEFIVNSVKEGEEISKRTLVRFLDTHFRRRKADAQDFHSFYDEHVERMKTQASVKRGGQTVTKRTIYEYKNTHKIIRLFEREIKTILDFDDIDQDLLSEFVAFLQRNDYATNTIYRKVTNIKAVMNAAVERELTTNVKWRFFKKTSEDTEAVALNEEELQRIHDLDLSKNRKLDRVRDLFLIACWTGLRFSDFTRIRKGNIKDGIITIRQSKTDEQVIIPCHPVFLEVWEKYGGLPVNISNQKFNEYIKEVCKEAQINDIVYKSITKGGKKKVTQYEKWQRVSSHTGRRSFATNLYKSGFPSLSIMKITGHKTESAFLKYIKVTKEEHARLLAKHWHVGS